MIEDDGNNYCVEDAPFLQRWFHRNAKLLGAVAAGLFLCLLALVLLSGSKPNRHSSQTSPPLIDRASEQHRK